MGASSGADKKYAILYGLKGSGKTLMLYNLHAKTKIFDDVSLKKILLYCRKIKIV